MSRQKGDIMREVLISIQPKWCELIASGKKTVEVRKTAPKLNEPFKCYIYCTKGDSLNYLNNFTNPKYKYWIDNKAFGSGVSRANGKVIGEFICDAIIHFNKGFFDEQEERDTDEIAELLNLSRLTYSELCAYVGLKDFYGWHISDLVIYDKPRELCEFFQVKAIRGYHKKDEPKTDGINIPRLLNSTRFEVNFLTRPPQSWCYIETRQTAD